MEDYLSCPVCLEIFDFSIRTPLLLCCGHTLCKLCVIEIAKKSLICPFDRALDCRVLDTIPKNITLLQIISHKSAKKSFPCSFHFTKKIKFYCFSCKIGFCTFCMPDHTSHAWVDLESDDNIKNKLKEPVDALILTIKQSHQNLAFYENHLTSSKQTTNQMILDTKKKFQSIRNEVDNKEKEILVCIQEISKEIQDKLQDKFMNALSVFEENQAALLEIQKFAVGINDEDFGKRIFTLNMIDEIIKSRKHQLLQFDDMMVDCKIHVNGVSHIKKMISKISVENFTENHNDSNQVLTKRKKLYDEVCY